MILPKLRHVLLAGHRKGHGIHSPFLYHLVTHVLFNKNRYYCFDSIETSFPATQKEHALGQTLFRLAEDINASTMVVCCESDNVDMAYLKSVKSDAQIVRLTDSEELKNIATIDLAVFDLGLERGKMIRLFDDMLLHIVPTSVFVIKKKYLKGTGSYWDTFTHHPRVTANLDLHQYGILLFRPDLEKKTYRIRQ